MPFLHLLRMLHHSPALPRSLGIFNTWVHATTNPVRWTCQLSSSRTAKGLAEAECHVPGVLRQKIRHTFCVRLGFQMLDGFPESLCPYTRCNATLLFLNICVSDPSYRLIRDIGDTGATPHTGFASECTIDAFNIPGTITPGQDLTLS